MRKFLLLLAVAILPASPSQAASYKIGFTSGSFDFPEVERSFGFRSDTVFTLAPSSGTGVFTGGAYCGPGYWSLLGRTDCTWDGGFSGTFSGRTKLSASTSDLIISGPAGPNVPGALHFRVKANLARAGGSPGNNAHNAFFQLNVSTLYSGVVGSITSGNLSVSGTGPFSGIGSPNVDMIVSLSGNYPVNTPFVINLFAEGRGSAYGNSTNNPGMAMVDAGGGVGDESGIGIRLEPVNGQIMTLPAGYTFHAPSWGVSNNANVVGVGDDPEVAAFRLDLAGENPASGDSWLSLSLPRDSKGRVQVFDAAGRVVRTLLEGREVAGVRRLRWDGRDDRGTTARPGLYFVRAEFGGLHTVRRIVRVR